MTILRPGTGTNPIYARKHGHVIPNALDSFLAGLDPEYQPTGAHNSIDALGMLCQGKRVEFRGGSRGGSPAPAVPKAQATTYSNEVFGQRERRPDPPCTTGRTPVAPIALACLKEVLVAGHGWSEQDSACQREALKSCHGDSVQAVIDSAFTQSLELDEKSWSTGSWSAGLATASVLAGIGAVAAAVFSNPGLAVGLACSAAVGGSGSALLSKKSNRIYNQSEILSDMGHRLSQKARGLDYDRHGDHGNYTGGFLISKV